VIDFDDMNGDYRRQGGGGSGGDEVPMAETPTPNGQPAAGTDVRHVLGPTLEKIGRSLGKEGAGLELAVDEDSHTVVATLVRHRITCEGCLLPEDLVQTMIRKALKSNREIRERNYKIETKNWLS
jgi:hypothetical protein